MIREFAGAACAVTLAASCTKPAPQSATVIPVQVTAVSRIAAPLSLSANGVVEPLQTVAVEAQVGGLLETVSFREGDNVQSGQLLFRIDPRPFDAALKQAQATLARDEVQARNASRDAERYKALVEKEYVTKAQADQAEATAAALHATLVADSAAVDNARINLAYTTIRAPIAGRTGRLLVRQGNVVRQGSGPLVVINQLRPILVRFPVTQKDFPALQRRVARGAVTVRVVTADSARVSDAGTLGFLDNAVDSLTGTVIAKAQFGNGTDALWPGQYVRVDVELEVQRGALAVPTRAVMPGQQGSYVFVVESDATAKVRPVTVGRVVGDMTTIEQGLADGDKVVVDGQSRLVPGVRVDAKSAPTQMGAGAGRGGSGATAP